MKKLVKDLIKQFHLTSEARKLSHVARYLTNSEYRGEQKKLRSEFEIFETFYRDIFATDPSESHLPKKRVLIVSIGMLGITVELTLIKAFQLAGYEPVILSDPDVWALRYYRLLGNLLIIDWDEFFKEDGGFPAEEMMNSINSMEDLVTCHFGNVWVGKYAASSALRRLRVGTLDPRHSEIRSVVREYLGRAIRYAQAAEAIVESVKPDLVLSVDPGYTPRGELYDACLSRGIHTITWNAAHKNNALILKRYSKVNRDVHPASLSNASWEVISGMDWTTYHRERLWDEIYRSYVSGEWYGEAGTQLNKRVVDRRKLMADLSLDPSKKTAVLFPHIFWDGTFFWGEDLFPSYEEWFVETVRMACRNPRVNWIIKIHPGNVVKNARDGFTGEPLETKAIREQIGCLPDHIKVVPAESPISTYSFFSLMDYCITVRGTVGIEAACFGSTVLTAGTGRYDRKGFTVDPGSRQGYLDKVRSIHELPSLSPESREKAERFAYGLFVLRPFILSSIRWEYHSDAKASLHTGIHIKTVDDWFHAPDVNAFAKWIKSGQEDYLATSDLKEKQVHTAKS